MICLTLDLNLTLDLEKKNLLIGQSEDMQFS